VPFKKNGGVKKRAKKNVREERRINSGLLKRLQRKRKDVRGGNIGGSMQKGCKALAEKKKIPKEGGEILLECIGVLNQDPRRSTEHYPRKGGTGGEEEVG